MRLKSTATEQKIHWRLNIGFGKAEKNQQTWKWINWDQSERNKKVQNKRKMNWLESPTRQYQHAHNGSLKRGKILWGINGWKSPNLRKKKYYPTHPRGVIQQLGIYFIVFFILEFNHEQMVTFILFSQFFKIVCIPDEKHLPMTHCTISWLYYKSLLLFFLILSHSFEIVYIQQGRSMFRGTKADRIDGLGLDHSVNER